jgi:hypothetical protein
MSESLGDLLKKRGSQTEPDDFMVIRKFVQDKYSITPKIKLSKNTISIFVPNSAIANNLRFDLYELSKKLQTKLRLVIKLAH